MKNIVYIIKTIIDKFIFIHFNKYLHCKSIFDIIVFEPIFKLYPEI